MKDNSLPSYLRYRTHLARTFDWLALSVKKGKGGSCAHFSPLLGWSKPYPETTGYLIPTLLDGAGIFPEKDLSRTAASLGKWLLEIQLDCGAWQGGLYPGKGDVKPSVFNTGQIVKGLCALARHTDDERWLEAASRGASWLSDGVNEDGHWGHQDYRSSVTPTYYTHVAWPMLEAWKLTQDDAIRDSAERVLRVFLERRCENGAFDNWGFEEGKPSFVHTIAYTLRGFLESARLTDNWEDYGVATVEALEVLLRRAELNGGRLSGAYDSTWKGQTKYTCLTGNVQTAICLLMWEEQNPDLRIVNAAAKLVDYVCSQQWLNTPLKGLCGGVAGSKPLWGKYMMMRYPNWAAKYHADGLMKLMRRLERETTVS
jgi:hypothetical protein